MPDLLVAAELRAHPEWAGRPLAISSGSDARAEIVALSPEAERAGVRRLASVVQARAVCSELRVRPASTALEGAARHTLRDVALSVSPCIEEAPRDSGLHGAEAAVYLDASGTKRLFHSEAGFAGALAERAGRLGLPAVVAVAASRGVAQLAARCTVARGAGEVEVVPVGGDAAFLAPLPLDVLCSEDELLGALARLGIRRLGELARLPSRGLATRLGPGALRLQQLARGEPQESPLSPVRDRRLEEGTDLDFPVEQLEPLAFVLRGLVSRLVARLELRGLACQELELSCALAGGGRTERRLGLAAPSCDERVLLRRLLLSLESHPPAAPVDGVTLALSGRPPRRDQLDLFRPAGPAPARLETLVAELEALCGEGQVGAPRTLDDWRPGVFGLDSFGATARDAAKSVVREGPALRALRPALPAQVRAPRGHPEWVRSALANGRVVSAAGPWRTSSGWWSPERRFACDHFDVETEDGLVTRLRFDLLARRWEIDGVYD
ncbi:MAG: DNA polymerase Y family protein [Myxococcota bacterium]